MGSSEVVAPVCKVCGERPARRNGRRGGAASFRRACSSCERSAKDAAVVAEVDEGLSSLLDAHEQEVAALKQRAAEDRQEVLLLKRSLREAEEQSRSLRRDLRGLQLELDGAKVALVEAVSRQEGLERARVRADDSVRLERTAALQAEAQRNELRARLQEMEPLRGEVSRLEAEAEEMRAELGGLRGEVSRLSEELEKSEEGRSALSVALNGDLQILRSDRDASRKEIETLRWEVTQANAVSADLEVALVEERSRSSQICKAKGHIEEELHQANFSLQGEISKRGDLQLERDDLRRRLALAEDERNTLRVDRRRALSSSAELQKDVDSLSGRLNEAQRAGRAFMLYGAALTAVVAFTCIHWLAQLI